MNVRVWEEPEVDSRLREAGLRAQIVIDPAIMDGVPVLRGTRIPVYIVLELLESGLTVGQILAEYPALTEEKIKSALRFASLATSLP